MILISLFGFLPSALILMAASIDDLKTHKVADRIWLLGALAGVLANFLNYFITGSYPHLIDLTIAGILVIMVLIINPLEGLGGADKIAMLIIVLINPEALFLIYFLAVLMIATTILYYFSLNGKLPFIPFISVAFFIAAVFA